MKQILYNLSYGTNYTSVIVRFYTYRLYKCGNVMYLSNTFFCLTLVVIYPS